MKEGNLKDKTTIKLINIIRSIDFFNNKNWMMNDKINLVYHIILTRQCNQNCSYCPMGFESEVINMGIINNLIKWIYNNKDRIGVLTLEFFGGEPLLEYEKIKYIVEETSSLDIRYTIFTNGLLLNYNMLSFFNKYEFDEINISISSNNFYFLKKNKNFFKKNDLSNFIVNLIIEPNNLSQIINILKFSLSVGFNKFDLIPIHNKNSWDSKTLIDLEKKIKFIKKIFFHLKSTNKVFNSNVLGSLESNEREDLDFVLGTDGNIYGDNDVELYLLSDIVPKNICNLDDFYIGHINNLSSLMDFESIIQTRKNLQIDILNKINEINEYLNIKEDIIKFNNMIKEKIK